MTKLMIQLTITYFAVLLFIINVIFVIFYDKNKHKWRS